MRAMENEGSVARQASRKVAWGAGVSFWEKEADYDSGVVLEGIVTRGRGEAQRVVLRSSSRA